MDRKQELDDKQLAEVSGGILWNHVPVQGDGTILCKPTCVGEIWEAERQVLAPGGVVATVMVRYECIDQGGGVLAWNCTYTVQHNFGNRGQGAVQLGVIANAPKTNARELVRHP